MVIYVININKIKIGYNKKIRQKPNNKLFNVGFQKTKLETAYSLRTYFAVLLIKSTS
jgi:hypothetical protein